MAHYPLLAGQIRFEALVFVEGGMPENPEKNPWSKDENHQQIHPTCDAWFENGSRATAVGPLHHPCSHLQAVYVTLHACREPRLFSTRKNEGHLQAII